MWPGSALSWSKGSDLLFFSVLPFPYMLASRCLVSLPTPYGGLSSAILWLPRICDVFSSLAAMISHTSSAPSLCSGDNSPTSPPFPWDSWVTAVSTASFSSGLGAEKNNVSTI